MVVSLCYVCTAYEAPVDAVAVQSTGPADDADAADSKHYKSLPSIVDGTDVDDSGVNVNLADLHQSKSHFDAHLHYC